ncbi:MAG: type II toxin-antitoxin system VapC family toxin [Deltaproteobacteria bacterium]|nr:type II toxin-antitoxin system VapC family toxin [Deltaproteobacteria bacterium]
MTRILLDTHVFVWALAEPRRVSEEAWLLLRDPSRSLALSIASVWELAIKSALGKLSLPAGVEPFVAEGCRRTGVTLLGVELAHVAEVERLPHHHRDPFDRMLVAQSRVEGMALLSFDGALDAYDVKRA